jgi:hypothetical protein
MQKISAPTTPSKEQLEADPQIIAGFYSYIRMENKGLRLDVASLQSLVNELVMEIKTLKSTLTALQPELQVPEAASALPSQQPKEKRKGTALGELSPMPRPPPKAMRVAPSTPPSPPPPPPTTCNDPDTMTQLIVATDDTAIVTSDDGFTDLISK